MLEPKPNIAAAEPSGFPAGLSQPALRALSEAGYSRLIQLTTLREADLAKLHGMGPKGIRTLRTALASEGMTFQGEQLDNGGEIREQEN